LFHPLQQSLVMWHATSYSLEGPESLSLDDINTEFA